MNWVGKKVLVTGAGGFIGSHLAESLVERGATVRALVRYRSSGSWGWLDRSRHKEEIQVVVGDVCDRESVMKAVDGVEVVFHLAALIAIPYSYEAPLSYLRTNVEGTLNVLQASRDLDVERMIHTSTSEVYGTAQSVPISESHPLQGQSPYSASKIAADKIVEAYHLSYGLPVVTVRPFNTYGPRQSARAIVPTIVSQCLIGNRVRLGSLSPTRDLNYVSDTVEGFILAGGSPEAIGRTINLGSGREISIGDLAKTVSGLLNRSILIEGDEERIRPKGSEVDRLLADSTTAHRILGWKPSVSLEAGLNLTVDWIQEHLNEYRPGVYVL